MNFSEAMEQLKSGKKLTRKPWEHSLYFVMNDKGEVESYQPKLTVYNYDEQIMLSEGWRVENMDLDEDKCFHEIVSFLQQGFRVRLKDWVNSYIFFDKSAQVLVIQTMDIFPFSPNFENFIKEDWMVLE